MRDGSRTKARIEVEALRLFAARGIDGTSIRDIASAVGVAEGALYRHFPSKEQLARAIFLEGYRSLAARVREAAADGQSFEAVVAEVIAIFCALFDEDRPRFTFLLLSQHAFLSDVPAEPEANVVEAVASIFRSAMAIGRIPDGNADLVAAMALGIVAQPATFTIYGRLGGPLADRADALTRAVLAAAGAEMGAGSGAGPRTRLRRAVAAP